VLTKTSALSRLRYWLHLVQAPKYGPGFVAAERRDPSGRASSRARFRQSLYDRRRSPPPFGQCRVGMPRDVVLSALEIPHRVDDRTTAPTCAVQRVIAVRLDMALWSVVRQHSRHHPSFSRLRYWLHPFQAPRYGTGFIASEER